MSGLPKLPEDRYPNEEEALRDVFCGIALYNKAKNTGYYEIYTGICLCLQHGKLSGTQAWKLMCAACPYDIVPGKRKKPAGCADDSWKRPSLMDYPTRERPFLSYEQLDAVFKLSGHPVYKRMHSQVNQNAIRKAAAAWKAYFKALKAYAEDPSIFREKPRRPRYCKDDEMTAWFTNQTAVLKEAGGKCVLTFVNSDLVIPAGRIPGKYIKTEVQPFHGGYRLLITSEDGCGEVPVPEAPKRLMGIDLGIDNFAAAIDNTGSRPFLIKGTALKSMNQWFNKRKSSLLSDLTKGSDSTHSRKSSRNLNALSRYREEWIRDFFYKAAHYICRRASEREIQVIVAGHNEGQKNGIEIGRHNNQAFVSITFAKFLQILRNTAAKYGIAYVEREESYTSKASLVDMDPVPTYGKGDGKHRFSGKRVKRGLYKTKGGLLVNADINGAGNILRKEYPQAFNGVDMSRYCKSVTTVGYKDLYPPGIPAATLEKHAQQKERRHRPGPASSISRRERWGRKIRLMEAYGASSKKSCPKADSTKAA